MTRDLGEVLYHGKSNMLRMWYVSLPEGKRNTYRHFHTRFEIGVVTKGSGVYVTDKNRYEISEGDVVVFPSNEMHTIAEAGSHGLNIINLQFEPIYIQGRSNDSLSDTHINFCFSHSDSFENLIPAERAGKIRGLFSMMEEEFAKGETEHHLAVKSFLNLIIIELLRNHGYADDSADTTRARDVIRVMKYIDNHLTDKPCLDDLSVVARMTPNYFSHIFKKYNGINLWDYIATRRLEQAVRLLTTEREQTILEIALSCGFNNTANFNKAFKRHFGITPTDLRMRPEYLAQ